MIIEDYIDKNKMICDGILIHHITYSERVVLHVFLELCKAAFHLGENDLSTLKLSSFKSETSCLNKESSCDKAQKPL